jgi:hypothetical protein
MTTIILTTDQIKAELFALLANQVTPTFISVKNYRNEQGEVSNYVINIGADYGTAKNADTETLKDAKNFEGVKGYSDEARLALLTANLKPSNQSKAQTDAYTTICPNVRMHNETGRIYVFGFRISKTVLVEGVYPSVNSSPLTLAKEAIRKGLKAPKFRQYCLDKLVEIRMKGETLEFEL